MRPLALVLVIGLLAGCGLTPVKAPQPAGAGTREAHAQALADLERWNLTGRAAVATASEAGTLSVSWRQAGERYSVELRAPLGAGTVQVQGGPAGVELRTSEGVQEFAGEPGELLARHTGLDLPLEALRYWLLGLPQPGVEARTEVDQRGLLTELGQQGWEVRYLRYGEFSGLALPTKLFMTGDGLEVRIAVQSWQVGP